MITQVFYNSYCGKGQQWATTASDKLYATRTRAHMTTPLKPTARQIRVLKRISQLLIRRQYIGSEFIIDLRNIDNRIIRMCNKIGAQVPLHVRGSHANS